MKKILSFGFWLFVLCQCDDKHSADEPECVIVNKSIIGNWKLIEECKCYHNGGDFFWIKSVENYVLTFDEKCNAQDSGDTHSNCNEGRFEFVSNQLVVTYFCSDGMPVRNPYDYSFSANGDTLLLKGHVDEGFVGSKYLRQFSFH